MSVTRSPLALFIFNRPQHLRQTIDSLTRCEGFDPSRVTVFADGPRRESDRPLVDAARLTARELLGPAASYREAIANKGLAKSISEGVTELTEAHGSAIVIEDDLSLSPQFLTYMDCALARYRDETIVYQVSGHMFDVPECSSRASAVMQPFTTTWGWGTWARAWRQFDPKADGWEQLANDKALRTRFNLGGIYDYATMLEDQMQGHRDSWGIKWYWTVFKAQGLTVYPPSTLVRNDGMDGSGSHGRGRFRRYKMSEDWVKDLGDITFPAPVLNADDVAAVRRAIWRQNGGSIGRAVDLAKRALRALR